MGNKKKNENYEVIEATSDSVPNPIIVGRSIASVALAENNRQSWWP
jgi:hypothetical protein